MLEDIRASNIANVEGFFLHRTTFCISRNPCLPQRDRVLKMSPGFWLAIFYDGQLSNLLYWWCGFKRQQRLSGAYQLIGEVRTIDHFWGENYVAGVWLRVTFDCIIISSHLRQERGMGWFKVNVADYLGRIPTVQIPFDTKLVSTQYTWRMQGNMYGNWEMQCHTISFSKQNEASPMRSILNIIHVTSPLRDHYYRRLTSVRQG